MILAIVLLLALRLARRRVGPRPASRTRRLIGYRGQRVGEASNPGPTAGETDAAQQEPVHPGQPAPCDFRRRALLLASRCMGCKSHLSARATAHFCPLCSGVVCCPCMTTMRRHGDFPRCGAGEASSSDASTRARPELTTTPPSPAPQATAVPAEQRTQEQQPEHQHQQPQDTELHGHTPDATGLQEDWPAQSGATPQAMPTAPVQDPSLDEPPGWEGGSADGSAPSNADETATPPGTESLLSGGISSIHEAAGRLGPLAAGLSPPLWVQSYTCHKMLSCLLWEASAAAPEPGPTAEAWLRTAAAAADQNISYGEFSLTAPEAVEEGFAALAAALSSFGIRSTADLAEWMRLRRRRAHPDRHLGSAAVNQAFAEVLRFDARAALLSQVIREVVVQLGRCKAHPVLQGPQPHTTQRHGRPHAPTHVPEASWALLDDADLRHFFSLRIPTIRSCPASLRGRWRHALCFALSARRTAREKHCSDSELRAWRLFGLLPVLLLHKPPGQGRVARSALAKRFDDFAKGDWTPLLDAARASGAANTSRPPGRAAAARTETAEPGDPPRRAGPTPRGHAACKSVLLGEVSRGRQYLTGATLAPGNLATLEALQSKRPDAPRQPLPDEVLHYQPPVPLQLDREAFLACLRSSPRGSAAGPGGCTFEHLRVLMDDTEGLEELLNAAESLARADVPEEVAESFMTARLTALLKNSGGVRGIAAGTTLRRLVARTLARQYGGEVEAACAPFQYALSTRAGTDCVGHVVRAVTDDRETATLLSIDGVGAFDYVSRAAMLSKVLELPGARAMLPFLRLSYAKPSHYAWLDSEGQEHFVVQGEGGEQGDPLMPLLFSLGIHAALEKVQAELLEGELLFAYLDDIYAVAEPARVRAIHDRLAAALLDTAGIRLNEGKTRVWNRAGIQPPGMDDLGEEVWSPAGVTVLGTPVGTNAFVQHHTEERLADEARLWDAIPEVPDLQCAWQLLLQCAGPRANHLLRTLPPSQSAQYARAHDDGMWATAQRLLGEMPGSTAELGMAKDLASLPMRLGGLGLRSAGRTAPAAYWASWADALPMIQARAPQVADTALAALSGAQPETARQGALAEAHAAGEMLTREGFLQRPSWADLRDGVRPQQHLKAEPGEWAHGWQYYASSTREHHFRGSVVLPLSGPADCAHLRSHSGRWAGAALAGAPTAPEFAIEPLEFRTLLLERLRLPLPLAATECEGCGSLLDARGTHRAACTRSGRIKRRATPTEIALARVCREAGAVVQTNVRLRDMNLGIPAADERRLEVLAQGLPCHGGAQLAVDITLRSALTAEGRPKPRAAVEDGAVAEAARRDKEDAYPELLAARRCALVVIAIETGGRWSKEAASFLEDLAVARARAAPPALRGAARIAWQQRWGRMLAVACQRAHAHALVAPAGATGAAPADGILPPLSDILGR